MAQFGNKNAEKEITADTTIQLRVTLKVKNDYNAKAKEKDMTLTAWVRSKCDKPD